MQSKETTKGYLKPWKFAGLMLTYWCSAKCDFCYECCHPQHSFWTSPKQIVDWWEKLDNLAKKTIGKGIKIHLTGGEPFGNYELITKILKLAREKNLTPLQKIETNGFWATNEETVLKKLSELKALGVSLITTNADIFHQEWVPIENIKLLVKCAKKTLGENGIRIRWQNFFDNYELIMKNLTPDELKKQSLLSGRERINGNAAVLSAKLLTGNPPETFANQPCEKQILKSEHIHIDPYGNIFPGVCCGIIIGNATNENIEEIYNRINQNQLTGSILQTLIEEGPYGLINFAKKLGFKSLQKGYISKCQLCYHIRWFLYHKKQCREWIGPAECYPANFDWENL